MRFLAFVQHEDETEALGEVEGESIGAALEGARELAGPVPLGSSVGVVPAGDRPPQASDRTRVLTSGWRTQRRWGRRGS